jgi:hypothetical protein
MELFATEQARANAGQADDNVLYSPSSNYAKERVKWESHHTRLGAPGRPYVKREFPMMLYLGGRPESGLGADTVIAYELVGSEREFDQWRQRGYRETPNAAIEAYQAQDLEIAKLAANIEHQKHHGLSANAIAEVERAQDATPGHLPMVPETPIVRRQLRDTPSKETK